MHTEVKVMAKKIVKESTVCTHCSCHQGFGWVFLIVGVLFLLQDLGTWDFFGLKWWTILTLVAGISMLINRKH